MNTFFLIIPLLAYLIGSIPFGLLLTKWAGLGDIRAIGSGNIGATNVLRTGNKKLALATLLLDFAKGAAIYGFFCLYRDFPFGFIDTRNGDPEANWEADALTWIFYGATHLEPTLEDIVWALQNLMILLLPTWLIIGHCFPVWLKFKGGKGVATMFGLTAVLNLPMAGIAAAAWLAVFFTTRYSSLAALIAWPLSLVASWFILGPTIGCLLLTLPVLIILIRHKDNIRRLIRREESRFSFGSKK